MSDFNFDLFTQPDQYEETLLRDRKAFVEYWKDAEKAEFVKDVIALANTARMLGKPAYLILGVRDGADGTPDDICGIGEMFARQIRQGRTEEQAFGTIRHEMADIVLRYITPLLSPDIQFAKYDEEVVGYVLIRPLTTGPFQVSQEFRSGRETYLRAGQCWLRFGESKHEVKLEELTPNDDQLRYCYAEVPYVVPSIWQRYFEEVQREMLKLTADAPEESAYQELRNDKGVPISKIVDDFLTKNDDRWLILQGAAGCGKSLFLQRLVNSLAQNGEQEMRDARRLEQFVPPGGFIPIYYRLRELTAKARTDSVYFTRILCNLLAALWQDNPNGKRPSRPEELFDNPGLRWLIVLDGLDEIGAHERRREFLRILIEFMQTYPRLRVILSTRPVLPLQNEPANLVEIAPLDEKQVQDFLMAYRTDQNDKEIDVFIESYKAWEDARKLLSVPVYLNAALATVGIQRKVSDVQPPPENSPLQSEANINTGEPQEASENNPESISSTLPEDTSLEVEQPFTREPTKREDDRKEEFVDTLPRLIERVYKAFWEREERRGRFENLKRLQCGTYQLAASQMNTCPAYVQRKPARRLFTEKGLRWVLEMGILDDDNEWQHIRFTIPSAQVYSAAKQVQGDIEGGFWADALRYIRRWREVYRTEIEQFYYDLTGNSLSTILQSQGGSNG
jgi:hypothetical protein